jgi:ABC-type transport system substrate-binding protein
MALVHIPPWTLGDEDEWLGAYLPGDTRNQIHLDDPKLNAIVARSRSAATHDERRKAIEDFQRYFHEQMYRVFVPKELSIILVKDNVKGYLPKVKGYDFPKHLESAWIE